MDGVPVVIEFDGKERYEWIEEEPVDSAAKHWQERSAASDRRPRLWWW